MKRVAVRNISRADIDLGSRVVLANTVWTRLKGLLGAPPLLPGEGMLLEPCQAVHMYGMKQALDVAFLGREGQVIALYHDLRPGQRSKYHGKARQALELPVGTLSETGTRVGDRLRVQMVSNDRQSSDGENDDR
ncbi:MAG: DUF192 domain-containing protein [Gemmatimonadota bacterium]